MSAWLSVLLLSGAVQAEPPKLPTLSADEQSKLAAGKVVFRPGEGSALSVGVLDVDAPPDKVITQILNAKARVGGAVKEVIIYQEEGDLVAARYESTVLGTSNVVHMVLECDRTSGYCKFWMDKTKENHIEDIYGDYVVVENGSGSRVYHRKYVNPVDWMPDFMRGKVISKSIEQELILIENLVE